MRFRLGLRYEEAYSAPQTLAGFKIIKRERKGRQGEKGGEWRGREFKRRLVLRDICRPWLTTDCYHAQFL